MKNDNVLYILVNLMPKKRTFFIRSVAGQARAGLMKLHECLGAYTRPNQEIVEYQNL